MKKVNPENTAAIMEFVNNSVFFTNMSMKVCELGTGFAIVELDIQKKHINPFGTVHGGIYSTIIDAATFWAVYCELDENIGLTTIDLSINFLSSTEKGKLIVEGKTIKIGRNICMAEADVKDIDGRLVAHGTSKIMVLGEKYSIEKAVISKGYPPVPPKFLY